MVSAEDDKTAGCLTGWQPTLLALYLSPLQWKSWFQMRHASQEAAINILETSF